MLKMKIGAALGYREGHCDVDPQPRCSATQSTDGA
jgi:hypothetical protein